MPTDSGSTLPRRQLGRYLREGRGGANLTLVEVSQLMLEAGAKRWSKSKLARIERGDGGSRIPAEEIGMLCRLYGFSEELTVALQGLAQQTDAKHWWHAFGDVIPEGFDIYVGLESAARDIAMFRPDLVPGLLQTADYARHLDRVYFPTDSEVEQNRRIELRVQRQSLITRKIRPARLDVVLQEAALRTAVGTPKVMAAQLRHLAEISTHSNVTVRILPFTAGFPLGFSVSAFVVLDFGQDNRGRVLEPPVVYLEQYTGAMYLDQNLEVAKYRDAARTIQRATLDAVSSRSLLRQVAKEWAA